MDGRASTFSSLGDAGGSPPSARASVQRASSSGSCGARSATSATPDDPSAASAGPFVKLGVGGCEFDAACPALHCTACNFGVRRFRACRWAEDADYMHFRNFNGHSYDLEKLRHKLLSDQAHAAYACQCAWQSVATWKPLDQWGTPAEPHGGAANGAIRWKKATAKLGTSRGLKLVPL